MAITLKNTCFIAFFFAASCAYAQTTEEWLSQKSTQKKYLLQQIAALQLYSKYLRSGYSYAKGGLGSISGSLKSENSLHSTYYTRLKTPSAPVKTNNIIKTTLNRQQDILKVVTQLNNLSGLSTDEKKYVNSVGVALLKDCDQQLQTLANITQDGKLEMSDAGRLTLLNKINTAMLENYRFICAFTAQVKSYTADKVQEQQEAAAAKRIYGLN